MRDQFLVQLVLLDAVLLCYRIVVHRELGAVVFRFLLSDDLSQLFDLQPLLLDSADRLCLLQNFLFLDQVPFALNLLFQRLHAIE